MLGKTHHRLLEVLFERVLPLMTTIYPKEIFKGSDECEDETCEHVQEGYDIGVHHVRRIWNVLNQLNDHEWQRRLCLAGGTGNQAAAASRGKGERAPETCPKG